MTKVIDFIFDFASPNAYFAYKVLPDIAKRHNAVIHYNPCLLGGIFKATGNQAPFMAFGHVKGKLDYERLEISRFIKKHGLNKFRMNPNFPVNSLILMRAAIAADNAGTLNAFIDTGMKAMWEDGCKMDDPKVFTSVMSDAGFDGSALLTATQDPMIKSKLMENTAAVVERGCFGIPSFFLGDDMYFGKDRLVAVEEALTET
ncbi:2-hydroxychromene-2-carboxylate isomerase [Litorimonas taeanensis]|uniref:2-hydroxychromene-2-carboxylate isomerase n=1 Tax=Litorimonas taeanensis TaxID=568099 RepID=A0A420WER2_9PROT|nr:2-hydroxychromene-2-carboxylate isomerase [Litorimonas taeanensis]RKQ69471.1 2-hydroxychromene-2-carboxylate isomerase [Litorimonas taeanensis]